MLKQGAVDVGDDEIAKKLWRGLCDCDDIMWAFLTPE
jgi:hypothetical protein